MVDDQGLSVPGVTVSVEGPNLQGVRTAVTSENGDYIVAAAAAGHLHPDVRAERLRAAAEDGRPRADADAAAERHARAWRRSARRSNVVGKSADVLTQTAQVATNFKQDLIATLPTNRDINAVAAAGAGGASDRARAATTRLPARCRSNRCTW